MSSNYNKKRQIIKSFNNVDFEKLDEREEVSLTKIPDNVIQIIAQCIKGKPCIGKSLNSLKGYRGLVGEKLNEWRQSGFIQPSIRCYLSSKLSSKILDQLGIGCIIANLSDASFNECVFSAIAVTDSIHSENEEILSEGELL